MKAISKKMADAIRNVDSHGILKGFPTGQYPTYKALRNRNLIEYHKSIGGFQLTSAGIEWITTNPTEENTEMTKTTGTTTQETLAEVDVQSLSKKDLAAYYNLLAPLAGQSTVKSFRDLKTGQERVWKIRGEIWSRMITEVDTHLMAAMALVKNGKVAKVESFYNEGNNTGSVAAIRDHESGQAWRKGALAIIEREILSGKSFHSNVEPISARSWRVSGWELTPEQQEELKKTARGGRARKAKKNTGGTKAVAKKTKTPAAPKYTRANALAESLRSLQKGTEEEIVKHSNDLYVKNGGKDNEKEARWMFRTTMPLLCSFGVIAPYKDGTYEMMIQV
jgi:hypothetical protein